MVSDVIGIDTTPPQAALHSITESSPYAHVRGSTVYYSHLGSGSFAVRVGAGDAGSGLAQAECPATVSPGGVYTVALSGEYQYEHEYDFDGADEAEGVYTVTVRDVLGHERGVVFIVARDVTAPVAWVRAPSTCLSGTFTVQWGAQDEGAGPTGLYDVQYQVDDGPWTDWLTGTVETAAGFTGETGHVYRFRVRTWDRVSNERPYPATPDAATRIKAPVTKYYYANGQRVALRQGDVVYYIHTDHLGSVSLLSDRAGQAMPGSVVRYLPYGGVRLGDAATLPTAYTFTGQREDATIGLYDYKARYYDPALGRFVQADTIVPEPGNPQALNRYAYIYNNPLRYTDPSGYCIPGVNCPGDISGVEHPGEGSNLTGEDYAAWLTHYILWQEQQRTETGGMLDIELGQQAAAFELSSFLMKDPELAQEIIYQQVAGAAPQLAAQAAGVATDVLISSAGWALGMVRQATRPPNPDGSLGGPAHRSVVKSIKADIEARGLQLFRVI